MWAPGGDDVKTLFDDDRTTLDQSLEATAENLRSFGSRYRHWAAAFSGGKDSSAKLTAMVYLLDSGRVPRPESLTVLYADTRMELPPLQISAEAILHACRKRGLETRTVLPELDDRFFVYMFGRGVPPPKNRFRWCTPQLKIEPMEKALRGLGRPGEKVLMMTGVRIGESAARDQTIAVSCSKDGAECGQGWLHLAPNKKAAKNINQYFVPSPADGVTDTLAPILHWRVCHVWEWLTGHAPAAGFPTAYLIADAYGGRNDLESLVESAARTGCVGCPLASRDQALERITGLKQWAYLAPLKRLRPLYAELQLHTNRLRKLPGQEVRKDGTLATNPGRVGPLTLEARLRGLEEVLSLQGEVNAAAKLQGRPEYWLINPEEEARIRELIAANTWPNRWDGTEVNGGTPVEDWYADGTKQTMLFGE